MDFKLAFSGNVLENRRAIDRINIIFIGQTGGVDIFIAHHGHIKLILNNLIFAVNSNATFLKHIAAGGNPNE